MRQTWCHYKAKRNTYNFYEGAVAKIWRLNGQKVDAKSGQASCP